MKTRILIPLLLAVSFISFAQTKNIIGAITNAQTGAVLVGVTIVVKGVNNGTYSDFNGVYSVEDVSVGQVLMFSYIGFKTQSITIGNDDVINVQLIENIEQLEGIVMVGYGTKTQREVTGSVVVVDGKAIEKLKPTRVEEALQGQSGISVLSTSGSPGAAPKINIRGVSTNGDNRPLILLDGNVIEDLSVVNPNDIASVSVVKDATAGIYGVRAANGVVLMTTKAGRKYMPLSFQLDAYTGFQQTTKKIELLSPRNYAILVNEAATNAGDRPVFTLYPHTGTDWQDQVFSSAPITSIHFTGKGGTQKSSYHFGVSHLTQDGIVGKDKSTFNRSTVRLHYKVDLMDKLKLSTITTYMHTNRKTLPENALGSVLFNALSAPPNVSVKDGNGNFTLFPNTGVGIEVVNPLAQINNTYNNTQVNKISGSYGLKYQFSTHLKVAANMQLNYADVRSKNYYPEVFYGSGKTFNTVSSLSELTNDVNSATVTQTGMVYKDYTFDAFLKYKHKFKTHHIKFLLGTSIFRTMGIHLFDKLGRAPLGNSFKTATVSNAKVVENRLTLNNIPKISYDSRLLSYFTRLEYTCRQKYLASLVLRRDGSTAFGPQNKFGVFPSASIGWIASKEGFLKNIKAVDLIKLRASYGVLGNDRIPANRFTSVLDGEAVYVFDGALRYGKAIGALSNPKIRWEKQKALDVGLDLSFFNRLNITADYFHKTTEDLLVTPQVSGVLGVYAPGSAAPTINAGTVENKGFEFSVGYTQQIAKDLSFHIKYNIATLKNKVLFVGSDTGILASGSFGVGQEPPSRMEAGYPIGYFYGYKTDGVFQNQSAVDAYATQLNAQPGDLRFVDVNQDGKIDDKDKTNIGNPIPDVTMGFHGSVDYKNVDFSFYAFASLGNDIVRDYERNLAQTNKPAYFLGRWRREGTSNSFPRVTTASTQNTLFSDFYVEDGSYVRLQNIQLGYTFPEKTNQKLRIKKIRMYASATNLLTITNYRGYDPTNATGANIGGGIDKGFYPNPKTFLIGINVTI